MRSVASTSSHVSHSVRHATLLTCLFERYVQFFDATPTDWYRATRAAFREANAVSRGLRLGVMIHAEDFASQVRTQGALTRTAYVAP